MEAKRPDTESVCRILVVEPNPQMGTWLVRLIEKSGWAVCAGLLDDPARIEGSFGLRRADTLLLDLDALNAFDSGLIPQLKSARPDLDVILMDYDSGPSLRRLAIRLGADGLVAKERIIEGLWEHKRTGPPAQRRENR